MNAPAKHVFLDQPDMTLGAVLAALASHGSKALVLAYGGGRRVQPGYHVTEVKAGSFVTLDCGGNPDAWQETVLQVEDLRAVKGKSAMTAGKFSSIIGRVHDEVRLDADARLTVEVSRPDEPMQVYDVAGVVVEGEQVIVQLEARPAICKPRHRAGRQAEAACCAPSSSTSSCCR